MTRWSVGEDVVVAGAQECVFPREQQSSLVSNSVSVATSGKWLSPVTRTDRVGFFFNTPVVLYGGRIYERLKEQTDLMCTAWWILTLDLCDCHPHLDMEHFHRSGKSPRGPSRSAPTCPLEATKPGCSLCHKGDHTSCVWLPSTPERISSQFPFFAQREHSVSIYPSMDTCATSD